MYLKEVTNGLPQEFNFFFKLERSTFNIYADSKKRACNEAFTQLKTLEVHFNYFPLLDLEISTQTNIKFWENE